ncbi:hemolysin-type calcium-binding protein [bacterium]|nr:hemolysin-type calcium-binding protein [bacterium]
MQTGSKGTFVISWSQTETDGVASAPLDLVAVGAPWRWHGRALRLDGPQDMLRLDGAEGLAEMRRRAARVVRRLIGPVAGQPLADEREDLGATPPSDQSFIVTDGHDAYQIALVRVADSGVLLALVSGALPPRDRDLWVMGTAIDLSRLMRPATEARGMICFTPGTWIATPFGQRRIEALRPGDSVLTRDNGVQPVLWLGHRRLSGARLHAMPHLRPIRFRQGALGRDRPAPDLVVSPQHRMLLKGRAAQALFNTDEVLVAAADLVNDTSIRVDRLLREVTYLHALLPQHNVIWANGLETESFHPARAAPDSVDPGQRDDLLRLLPHLRRNPQTYGEYARRALSASEAAILRHEMTL